MKLIVEGWREDCDDPRPPVAVIGFCAGGRTQTRLNFEEMAFLTAASIREAQRLGLADVEDPERTSFIPAYDQKIPQLHTKKKRTLGERTARWALKTVKDKEMWNEQIFVSSPLVKEPVSVRYAWARSPMGNLKVEGKPWHPLHNFRTGTRDFCAKVEHSDPDGQKENSQAIKEMREQAKVCLARRLEAETMITGEK